MLLPKRTPGTHQGHRGNSRAHHPTAGRTLALPALARLIVSLDCNIVYVALPGIGASLGFPVPHL